MIQIQSKRQFDMLDIGSIVQKGDTKGIYVGKKYSEGCSCGCGGSYDPIIIYAESGKLIEEKIISFNKIDPKTTEDEVPIITGFSEIRKLDIYDKEFQNYMKLLKIPVNI